MRSEMISRAHQKMSNRYELCQTAARVTRCLHFASADTQSAINDAFTRLAMPTEFPPGLATNASADLRSDLPAVNTRAV